MRNIYRENNKILLNEIQLLHLKGYKDQLKE